jgi:hypothetical protein
VEEQFLVLLHQFRRRLRWTGSLESLLLWSFWGCWAGVVATALLKLFDADPGEQWNGLWLAVVVSLGGFMREWSRPPSLRRTAILTDRVHSLNERVISALDLQQRPRAQGSMSAFLLQDALRCLQELDPRLTFPLTWQRRTLLLIPPILMIGLFTTLPSWSQWLYRVTPADRAAIRRSANRLNELARQLRQHPRHNKRLDAIAKKLEQRALELQAPGLTKTQAAQKLQQASKELRTPSKQRDSATDAQKALQALKQSGTDKSLAEKKLKEQLAAAEKGSEEEKRLKEALDKLKSDPSGAEKALQELKQSQEQESSDEHEAQQTAEETTQSECEALDPSQKGRPGEGQGKDGKGGPKGQPSENRSQGSPDEKGQGTTDKGDFGRGTTNKEEKGKDSGPQGRLIRQSDKTPSREEAFEKLYEAQRNHFDSEKAKVQTQRRKGQLIKGNGFAWGAPSKGGQPVAPASAHQLEVQTQAEQAIQRGEVPPAYREAVRNYFQSGSR